MKKWFLYYSLTGNGDLIASELKKDGFDVYKVETKRRTLPKNFVLSMFVGGFISFLGLRTRIKPIGLDIDKYNEVYIGSPIWNARLACPPQIQYCINAI